MRYHQLYMRILTLVVFSSLSIAILQPLQASAEQSLTIIHSTTTVSVSICGDFLINDGEACDVPGEVGVYSTTIAGRQCNTSCQFGPYCGDGILQTLFGEECDDGNNTSSDFCSALCKIEVAGSGGGGSGGGGGSSGGDSREVGDTQVSVAGTAYPNQTVHIIFNAEEIGTVRANAQGAFSFAFDASPGTASVGFWANDSTGVRSVTLNLTFDVTQGAITNIRGVMLPPTISVDTATLNPGDKIALFGQTAPNKKVELFIDNVKVAEKNSGADGRWSIDHDSSKLSLAEHLAKVRYTEGGTALVRQSNFSNSLTLFVGVEGRQSLPSDLNRDGKINLTDFSILIFWWQTNGGNSNPPADINGNGKVGIEDFSILLFNWTG